jgi:hypothetical protein
MAKTNVLSWLLPDAEATRRAAVAIVGLGLMTGLATTSPSVSAADTEANTPSITQTSEPSNAPAISLPGTPADKPAEKPVQAKPKAPSAKELTPNPVTAEQQRFTPTVEQMRNAKAIVETGEKMKLPPRAQVIAVATALQESTLHNYGHLGERNDHDSQGLFQQRPSMGWGTPEQITNPEYAATKFYERLVQVKDWDKKPLTVAAQTVQVSAFPNHYAKWEKMAADLVLACHGEGPYAKLAAEAEKAEKEKAEKETAHKAEKAEKADER